MLTCPRCRRPNPSEAVFCHFDGAELRPVHGGEDGGRRARLPHEFVFPSGRRCQTYEDLARGCQEEWEVARDLLGQGVFRQFLASAGRMDLARAAQEAKSQPDADLALDMFLSRLPFKLEQSPRLDLSPRRLNLGTLHVGDTRQIRLTVFNQGKGLLHGSLAVAEGTSWLRVGNGQSNGECTIKTAREQPITLRIDTRGLSAPHKYSAKLTVITNGGIVEVPVRLDLAVYTFPKPPFQGAASPRDMAERMRTQPKPAVPLLENGDLARWFAINGWTYPVLGPTAKGVAAVQQFFEGMGLSKPPTVVLSQSEFHLSGFEAEPFQAQVTLRTDAKKWVYARVESDAPWLRVNTASVSGPQQAVIAFAADARDLPPNQIHEGHLKVQANAGQMLTVRVQVQRFEPTAVTRSGDRPTKGRSGERTIAGRVGDRTTAAVGMPTAARPGARALYVGAMAGLVFRLLLALPGDLYARVLAAEADGRMPAGSFASWLTSPASQAGFMKHFVLATCWLGAVLGALVLLRRGEHKSDAVFGGIAGAAAGLGGSATFACILPTLDALPRLFWGALAVQVGWTSHTGAVWLWTPMWIAFAVAVWTVAGAGIGFVLGMVGQPGSRILRSLAEALSWIFGLCGLRRAAAYFAVQ